jgi:hypothetical protein
MATSRATGKRCMRERSIQEKDEPNTCSAQRVSAEHKADNETAIFFRRRIGALLRPTATVFQ